MGRPGGWRVLWHEQDRTTHARQGTAGVSSRRALPKDDAELAIAAIAPNVSDWQFMADQPNRKWIADLTYIWTAEGRLGVVAVINLESGRVFGWLMKVNITSQLVTDTLLMAIWRRGKPDALLHHSDRGNQYSNEQSGWLMADNGANCSMI